MKHVVFELAVAITPLPPHPVFEVVAASLRSIPFGPESWTSHRRPPPRSTASAPAIDNLGAGSFNEVILDQIPSWVANRSESAVTRIGLRFRKHLLIFALTGTLFLLNGPQ